MKGKISQGMITFLTGGIVYFYFEIFVRGYSHISMFILGGICFLVVGKYGTKILLNEGYIVSKILKIMILSGAVITFLEFVTGCIVNIILNLGVWDYSNMDYNFRGQICLSYSLLWTLMGLPCVYLYGVLNEFIFWENGESIKP